MKKQAGERYSNMDGLAGFGFLINALGGGGSGDGDTGSSFPRSDAEDMSRGARFIPGKVTMARRGGQKVRFVGNCGPCCWYWEMPDGSRIYHWDGVEHDQIALHNKKERGDAGPCPHCGNPHTNGGTVPKGNL